MATIRKSDSVSIASDDSTESDDAALSDLPGIVVYRTDNYGFIAPHCDLPVVFSSDKDVHFHSRLADVQEGDFVRFNLNPKSSKKPSAQNVWLDTGPRDDVTQSRNAVLTGQVVKRVNDFGFIRSFDDLPDGFIKKNVFLSCKRTDFQEGDIVGFILKKGSETKPEACRAWVITESDEDDHRGDNSDLDAPQIKKARKSSAGTNEAASTSIYLKGVVVKISETFGFIKCTDNLPTGFIKDDVYFRMQSDIGLHDIVEFQLEGESKSRPTACNVKRITAGDTRSKRQTPKKKEVKRTLGTVVKVLNGFGYIKVSSQISDTFSLSNDIYFQTKWVRSGGFDIIAGDQLEFTLCENTKRENEMSAIKLKVLKFKKRDPQVIVDHVRYMQQTLAQKETNDFLLDVLSCNALWECIGHTWAMDEQGIFHLLDLLLLIHEKSRTLEENYRHMLEVLVNSEFCSTRNGILKLFIKNAWNINNLRYKEKVQAFFLVVLNVLPLKARLIVGLSREMLPQNKSDTLHFFHAMLKKVTMAVTGVNDLEWEELPLVPATNEIHSGPLESAIHLSPVKKQGPYDSVEEYMDIYFRLLRTDCFNALCTGIRKFLKNSLDPRDMNIYTNVELKGIHITDDGNGIALAVKVKPHKPIKNWETCSNLMFGNLLCLSPSGKFTDPIWAIVMKRDTKLLKSDQIIWIQLCSECNTQDDTACLASLYEAGSSTILAESPTYYLAHQPVLKALQGMKPENLSFQDELVDLLPPQQAKTLQNLDSVHISKTMDPSQREAFIQALDHRLAIIQGPPGTGKTYIGIELVREILSSSSQLQLPILVLTYKNHALDEFLKELLPICSNSVARVGGRCQDPELKGYNLQMLRSQHSRSEANYKMKYALQAEATDLKQKLERSITNLGKSMQLSIEAMIYGLSESQIKSLLLRKPIRRQKGSEEITKKDLDLLWSRNKNILFNDQITVQERRLGIEPELFVILSDVLQMWVPNEKAFQDISKNEERLAHILKAQTQNNDSNGDNDTDDTEDGNDDIDVEDEQRERLAAITHQDQTLEMTIKFDRQKKGKLPELMPCASRLAAEIPLVALKAVSDLWALEEYDRAVIIQVLVWHYKSEVEKEVKLDFESYKAAQLAIKELDNENNVAILKGKKVVGMTITGASIHNKLLQALRPAIVIVEEAAEVLEPQLIAALGDWVKHLILIGDHMQLKPGVETYELVRKYNFDISMMERLINNNYPYASLKLQNRMRPEIAELLLDIYPDLSSNKERVEKNEPPEFIRSSHFFWSHEEPEGTSGQSRSIVNKAEAERVIRLTLLFIQQGYKPSKITILGAYQGQVSLLRKLYREAEKTFSSLFAGTNSTRDQDEKLEDEAMEKVKIHTIDMYQGDENEIVIISLVRSNAEGRIGFLKTRNRRCVSQSRARCGMYFVGNQRTFLSQSSPWCSMLQTMQKNQLVSQGLPLRCPYHFLFSQIIAIKPSDIPLDGLCKKPCILKMECMKHKCPRICQPFHSHQAHLCKAMVEFIHENCGHPGKRECRTPESQVPCLKPCWEVMQCKYKHPCPKICQPRHSHLPNYCEVEVPFIFAKCGHSAKRKCGEDVNKLRCQTKMPFRFSTCCHSSTKKCYQAENEIACSEKCTRKLKCGHPCEDICSRACDHNKCKPCERRRKMEERKQREAEEKAREEALEMARKELKALERCDTGRPTYSRVDLHPVGDSASEYNDVKDKVMKYIQPGHGWYPKLTRIEKVTNATLQRKWLEAKLHMFDPMRSELKFHGTGDEGIKGIISEGFRLSSPQGNMYGGGVYFATDSSKSAQKMYTKDSNKLLLCDVLLGKSLTVDKAIDMDFVTLRLRGYDSLYAKRDSKQTGGVIYDEFVVYRGEQALPKYIIHYVTIGSVDIALPRQVGSAGVQSVKLLPKRSYDENDAHDMHFRLAESQFLRLAKHAGIKSEIKSVTFFTNPLLQDRFRRKKREFRTKDTVLAFHGTPMEQNIDKIMTENFRMDRCKTGLYGAGIYFSEFPNTSIGYAGSLHKLILCQILPGKSYPAGGNMNGVSLKPGYDSHTVNADQKGRAQMIVIFNPDQILPLYVIDF